MSTQSSDTTPDSALPDGRWQVTAAGSTVAFASRTMWGLSTVKGTFSAFEGELTVAGPSAQGALEIEAASLDTGNRKRDEHLRSSDFFAAAGHPQVRFAIDAVTAGDGDGVRMTGTLTVKDRQLPLDLAVAVRRSGEDRLRLSTTTSVVRADADMTWNRMGMLVGDATLDVDLELERTGPVA
jgi:polyisoprenoid-binding protein YceI